jgi:hypothetical protein
MTVDPDTEAWSEPEEPDFGAHSEAVYLYRFEEWLAPSFLSLRASCREMVDRAKISS